jgi:glycerophosphoryl diester phosphodiesterase
MADFLDHAGVLAFAHRGDHLAGPENTMAAFEGAVMLGYRYLETDIHCSQDGYLLAFHDSSLDRVTNQSGLIANLDYASIQRARIAGSHSIPLIEDLIEAFPDARINIDLKSDQTVKPFMALVKRLQCQDRICVGSFSSARVEAIRANFPNVCTSLSPKEVGWLRLRSYHVPTPSIEGRCAQIPERTGRIRLLDQRLLHTAHKLGIQVHVWTINDESEMARLADLGVNGIMTDQAALLKDVLTERNLWTSA